MQIGAVQLRGFVQCRHFADKGEGGILQMWIAGVRTFWCTKLQIFEIYGVYAWAKLDQFFAILCGPLL